MKKLIIKWLKTKLNYCYYDADLDDEITYNKKMKGILFSSRVHFEDLNASSCYIIENNNENIEIDLQVPSHHKHSFKNYNFKCNEYIYEKVKMKEISKNFTVEDSVRNRVMGSSLLSELKLSYSRVNKFLDQSNKFTYKDVFFDTNSNNVDQFTNDARSNLRENIFAFDEFKSFYIDSIKEECKDLKEVGVFFPFVLNHNIFKNEYYLLEINHIRFQKYNNKFEGMVRTFFKDYNVNSDTLKDLLTLEEYFAQPGFQYVKSFAYFDPFKNYSKYKEEYKKIEEYFKKYKLDFEKFIFDLFEFLNQTQIGVVKFQHENLINSLTTKRSKKRQYSIKELISMQLNKLYRGELNLENSFDIEYYSAILESLKSYSNDFNFNKNTKIEDMECYKIYSPSVRQDAQFVLDDLLTILNKSDHSKLQWIYEYYLTKSQSLLKKYELKREHKSIIKDMIVDLIIFYNDKSIEKLSRPYNNTIEKIYLESRHLDIDNVIDFNFKKKFIDKYRNDFEKYVPFQTRTEDYKTKYIFTHGMLD